LLLAALIPAAAFTMYQLMRAADVQQQDAEEATLTRADEILALANARLSADLSIAQTLAQSIALDDGQFVLFRELALRVQKQTPGWVQIVVVDAATDRQVMNLLRPFSDLPLPAVVDESYKHVKERLEPAIGGIFPAIEGTGEAIVPVRVPVIREGKLRYILSVGVQATIFQGIVLSKLPDRNVTTAGIVDRNGVIIARSRDPEQWVGKPAAAPLREAIATRTSGIYPGRIHEGIQNYTAFTTSSFTGWSAHIALDAASFDRSRSRSRLLATLAGLACIGLGTVLVVLIVQERMEQKRAEATLHQMQRLEALGKMTGGIAHDFNNLLAVIIGNIEMMRRQMGDRLPPQVGRIAQAAERGEKLVQQMLAFARRQPLQPQVIDLNRHIRGMSDMFKRATRGDIVLSFDLPEGIWPIEADPVQLESALLNLAINARDAMPEGGTISIATRNVPALGRRGDFVQIVVSDTGTGIAPETLARVFDPFFTTKPPGEGTGLGLSMVHGFAGQSGGTAEIESQLGQGTTVRLTLPRATRAELPVQRTKIGTVVAPGRGKILVVEDNEELLEMTVALLAGLGYEIRQTANPREALVILETFAADLIFSDILMPGGINGLELAREASRRYPGIEIVLATGDAGTLSAAEHSEFTILQKPYRLDVLSEVIQRALQHPSERPTRRAG
jgi:signal transduction histidine kinase